MNGQKVLDDLKIKWTNDDIPTSMYFSFFGSVKKPERPWPMMTTLTEDIRDAISEGTDYPDMVECPIEEIAESDGIRAYVYRLPEYARYLHDQAILIVECPNGGWTEVGLVAWPLEFTSPAQVAGSCCNPRFGL